MDPVGARQIKDLIADLGRRGKTVLLCTHQLSDVEDLCDRVAIMFGGKVRAEGTCDELLSQENLTNLQTDAIPEAVVEEIRGVLARHGVDHLAVERPRRRLESLFLEIVDKARSEGTDTSGARSGGHIPDFLRDVTRPDDAIARRPEPDVPAGETQPAPPKVDDGLIDSLVKR
jgi:ABC-2 type transport system ATP-binding protein